MANVGATLAPLAASVADDPAEWRPAIQRAVEFYGTPLYVTRLSTIVGALRDVEDQTFPAVRSWLSFKTHPLPPLLQWWVRSGRGVEVVSEAELAAARRFDVPLDRLLVNGVAKHSWLPRYALPRLRVHFDSTGEVDALLPLALEQKWRVGVRLHAPDECDAREPRFGGQFGMTEREAVDTLRRLQHAGCDVQSIHFHLGQRQLATDAFVRAVEHAAHISEAAAFRPRFVDCGGGLPARPCAQSAVDGLRSAIDVARTRFSPELEEIWLENGRFVTGESSALAIRVLDVKERPDSRYLVCDGGRTNHALAADNGRHPILTIPRRSGALRLTTICGPTCMTDDTLGRMELPDDVAPGDILVWLGAGAYHLPWETRFSHGLCAVAWYDEAGRLALARKREAPEDWIEPWL